MGEQFKVDARHAETLAQANPASGDRGVATGIPA
jgi:hypothetical protein